MYVNELNENVGFIFNSLISGCFFLVRKYATGLKYVLYSKICHKQNMIFRYKKGMI